MMEPNPLLIIRPLRASDLDQRIFDVRSRPHGVEWLERQEQSQVYIAVAELDGIPVGRVGIDFKLNEDKGTAYLWSAHVDSEFQSRGIGTALFLHLEHIALQRGFTLIEVEVGKNNPRARQLYERLGYQVYGEAIGRWSYREGDRIVEVVEDNWSMRKSLVPSPKG
jgi:ribosomal protein S18 acetylase RimI-like enzyme